MSSIITCTCTVRLNRFYADVPKNYYCLSLLISQQNDYSIPSNYNLIVKFNSLDNLITLLNSLLRAANLTSYNNLNETNFDAKLSIISKYCYEEFYSLEFNNSIKLYENTCGAYFATTNDF